MAGEFLPGADDEEGLAKVEIEWEQRMSSAIQASGTNAGTIGGRVRESLEAELAPSQIPWTMHLRPFVKGVCRSGRSFQRPCRRSAYRRDLIIPGRLSKTLRRICLILDTSFSMGADEVLQGIQELRAIGEEFKGSWEVIVMQFDTEVTSTVTYSSKDLPTTSGFMIHGRGGTNFLPVLEELQTMPVDCAIFLTDGWPCDGWGEPSGIPILWGITDPGVIPPWGQYVRINCFDSQQRLAILD